MGRRLIWTSRLDPVTHAQVLKERDFPYSEMKMLSSARCVAAPPLTRRPSRQTHVEVRARPQRRVFHGRTGTRRHALFAERRVE